MKCEVCGGELAKSIDGKRVYCLYIHCIDFSKIKEVKDEQRVKESNEVPSESS